MTSDDDAFELQERLLDKSIEAYVLALETINRLTIQYRLETFCYLICNAWELLLKSKLILDAGDDEVAFYPAKANGEKRSISLTDCLKRLFPISNEPVRKNIERVTELRDESVHLVIGEIPHGVIGLLQACVTNYHRILNDWFQESLSKRYPVPMMNVVYDVDPGRYDLSDSRLEARLGPDAFDFLSKFNAKVETEREALGGAYEFFIEVQYGVHLVKMSEDADIILTSGESDHEPAHVVEVAKDSSVTHPFRQMELLSEIKRFHPRANRYDIQCINAVFGVKSKREWFYQSKVRGSPGQYSRDFADWIENRFDQNPGFFGETRKKRKELDRKQKMPFTVVV